jgi:hypothetical protein
LAFPGVWACPRPFPGPAGAEKEAYNPDRAAASIPAHPSPYPEVQPRCTGCRAHPGCTKVIATRIKQDVECSRGAESLIAPNDNHISYATGTYLFFVTLHICTYYLAASPRARCAGAEAVASACVGRVLTCASNQKAKAPASSESKQLSQASSKQQIHNRQQTDNTRQQPKRSKFRSPRPFGLLLCAVRI